VGAINGTHMRACVSQENQIPFIGRKGVSTSNPIDDIVALTPI